MKKILIIHTAFIGDIVLSTPFIRELKKANKDCKIDYLTTPVGKMILENNPNIDDIIIYDKKNRDKGIRKLLKLGKYLKQKRYDEAYIPHRYLRSSFLAFLAGIKNRIGYKNSQGKIFLTKKIKYTKTDHEVDRILNLIGKKNITNKRIELFPGEKEEKYTENIWEKYKLYDKKVVAVAPGSKWKTKMWPISYFNKVIEMLDKQSYKILLLGGKDEEELEIKETKNTINLIGKTSLLELAALIKKSDILISNDSAPIHIASAFDTFVIAIFGATTKDLGFYPWSKQSLVIENKELECRPCGLHGSNKCPLGHFKCMLDILPEKVYEEIIKNMER